MRDFRSLIVWQKASLLTDLTYGLIDRMPPIEQFDLASQMRRAAQSIELNISGGCRRKGETEFARFLQIAMASASELENCLDISRRRAYGPEPDRHRATEHVIEVKKMLASLIRKLRSKGLQRRR